MQTSGFTDILLYNRNATWVEKNENTDERKDFIICGRSRASAGWGEVINLLKKAGYTVTPVDNKVKKVKEI